MHINWYGQACFKIQSGDVTVILNPFDRRIGLNPPRGKADIVLFSSGRKSDGWGQEAGFVVDGAGEYEIKDTLISGFSFWYDAAGSKKAPKKATVYKLNIEGINVCCLDGAGKQEIDGLLERLGEVDILMAPVGGNYVFENEEFLSLDAEAAAKVIAEIEPRIVIPMNYKLPKLNIKMEGPEKFLKIMGVHESEAMDKLTIKRKDLPQEETRVVLLKTSQS